MKSGRYCNGTNQRGHGCSVWLTNGTTNCGQHRNGIAPAAFPSVFSSHPATTAVASSDLIAAHLPHAVVDHPNYVPRPEGALSPPSPEEHNNPYIDELSARKYVSTYLGKEEQGGFVIEAPNFIQTHHPKQFSGHKLHIACASSEDVVTAVGKLHSQATLYGLGMKAAAKHLMKPPDRFAYAHQELTYGRYRHTPFVKGVSVYLPRRDTVDRDTAAVLDALEGYECPSPIVGDNQISGPVWHRYEFSSDPGKDVDFAGYTVLYRQASTS